MSKHIGRKSRWSQEDARRHTSELGEVVYRQGAWHALLNYHTRLPREAEHERPVWQAHAVCLGPFKRARDAMVALEREVTFLRNRHGGDVRIGDRLWAEA